MLSALSQLAKENIIRPLDYQFARFLAGDNPEPLLLAAAALTSLQLGHGHTCLELDKNPLELLGRGRNLEPFRQLPPYTTWAEHLQHYPAIGDGLLPTPLVLDNNRLYLMRYWQYEVAIARRMNSNTSLPCDLEKMREILHRLFPRQERPQKLSQEPDWQMIAAAVAATHKFSVISGGPGTGKTTTVTRLLALLVELHQQQRPEHPPIIHLAAPTGKAAARLTETIGLARMKLNCAPEVRHAITAQATTIHRLLGVIPGQSEFHYNRNNPLHVDILVVDEASMIDSSLMAKLLEALPAQTQLILLGDRDQLASVEAGSVLGDICSALEFGYSHEQIQRLQKLTGFELMQYLHGSGPVIRDGLCLLRKSYRFDANSGIGQLAKAVNSADRQRIQELAQQPLADLQFYYSGDIQQRLLKEAVAGYRPYLEKIKGLEKVNDDTNRSASDVLEAFDEFQVLCALREGTQGVNGLNDAIRTALQQAGLIRAGSDTWYHGRPILITRNDPALELYNGDIGITFQQADGRFRVVFPKPDGELRTLLPSRLPEHETVFAMTVHKSQGSEFKKVVMVLPDSASPVVTRELLYTGITRAKSSLLLFARLDMLTMAINHPVQRVTGLADRLL